MGLSEDIKKSIAEATVRITKKGGLGVLVPGNLILTVAHCATYQLMDMRLVSI